jgi:hypothetical protein
VNQLDEWTTRVLTELGLDDDPQVRLVLALSKDVAHGVVRPAAPVTAYLLGLAVGRGADPVEAARRITALVPPPAPGPDSS